VRANRRAVQNGERRGRWMDPDADADRGRDRCPEHAARLSWRR
jgi:hypothetical protein